MMLAVAMLHEKFTVLQAIGSVLMLGGSFVTQSQSGNRKKTVAPPPMHEPVFRPRVLSGYLFAFGAAMCYGSSPLMARQAFLNAPGTSTAAAGCLAYSAATLFFLLILLKPGSWANIRSMSRVNLRGFSRQPCSSPFPRPSCTPRSPSRRSWW